MIAIEREEKRVNWHKIRADYISGISQRKLAEKYGVSVSAVQKRSKIEGWTADREKAKIKIAEKVMQKTAEKAADNASLAADIKRKGLLILDALMDDFKRVHATEHRDYDGSNVTDIKRLRDLTAAYKDLTEDIQASNENKVNELLQSLVNLERRQDND